MNDSWFYQLDASKKLNHSAKSYNFQRMTQTKGKIFATRKNEQTSNRLQMNRNKYTCGNEPGQNTLVWKKEDRRSLRRWLWRDLPPWKEEVESLLFKPVWRVKSRLGEKGNGEMTPVPLPFRARRARRTQDEIEHESADTDERSGCCCLVF